MVLCAGTAWAGENQTLTDLEALTAKYAPLPVKVDAEVALAAVARSRDSAPALSAQANIDLNLGLGGVKTAAPRQLAVPGTATVGLQVEVAGKPLALNAGVSAVATPQAKLGATVVAKAKAGPTVALEADVGVDGALAKLDATAEADASVALGSGETVTDGVDDAVNATLASGCLLYTSPSPRDQRGSRMPSSA